MLLLIVGSLFIGEIKPALPDPQSKQLIRQMNEIPSVDVREHMDMVWADYRELQRRFSIDFPLQELMQKFVHECVRKLISIDPLTSKREYNRKKSAAWNRENASKPVRTYDSFADSDFSFGKQFELFVFELNRFQAELLIVDGVSYLILSVFGKSIPVELPKNTSWDHSAERIFIVAELQQRKIASGEYDFQVFLKPLVLDGTSERTAGRVTTSGAPPGAGYAIKERVYVFSADNVKAFE